MRGLRRVLLTIISATIFLFLLAAAAYAVNPACYPWDVCFEVPLDSDDQDEQVSEPFEILAYPASQMRLQLWVTDTPTPGYYHGTQLLLIRQDTGGVATSLTLRCPDSWQCDPADVTVNLDPAHYILRLKPRINEGLKGRVYAKFSFYAENDGRDDRCMIGSDEQAYVVPGYGRWGNLEFSGDEDWQTVVSPVQKKMLLALNLAGNAETQGKDYDLSLWSPDCETRLANSHKNDPGMASADRVLVDVAPNVAYRSQVTGRSAADFETTPNADYHQAAWFGNVNRSFQLYHVFCYYDPNVTPEAPGGYLRLWARVNNRLADFRDLTLYTTYLPTGQKLARVVFWKQADNQPVTLTPDDPTVNGVEATVAVPNLLLCHQDYPSALCRLDKGDSFSIELAIGLPQAPYHPEYCLLDMDLYGNPVLEFEEAAASLGNLEGANIHMQAPAAAQGTPSLLHLPLISR